MLGVLKENKAHAQEDRTEHVIAKTKSKLNGSRRCHIHQRKKSFVQNK
jgi:hypothetical protein